MVNGRGCCAYHAQALDRCIQPKLTTSLVSVSESRLAQRHPLFPYRSRQAASSNGAQQTSSSRISSSLVPRTSASITAGSVGNATS
jgi:hypothetical protein